MTAAATLSTTRRRSSARKPAAMRVRSAVTVVRRSSKDSTGTVSTAASASVSARAARAAGPSDPSRESGRPTTTRSASSSATRAAMRAWSVATLPDRVRTVSGDAIVPLRSLTATPMRFEPRSSPSTRTAWSVAVGAVAPAGARRVAGDAKRLVDAGRVLPARDRDIALAAAAALDHLGGVAEEVSGLEPGVGTERGDERRPTRVAAAAEDDHGDARLVADGDREVAEV